MIRYRCLILDHDDTVVRSTKEIHYPAFVEMLSILRPHLQISIDEFISYNFTIGFLGLCKDVLKLNDAEMEIEYRIWKKYTRNTIPKSFPDMKELLVKFKQQGIIVVSSHSESYEIKRDYLENFGFEPDHIFGWDIEESLRKPNPFCIEALKEYYQFENKDLIMLDDSKSGYLMCKAANIPFIGNCYYESSQEIKSFFYQNADFTVDTVKDLYPILFRDSKKDD